MERSRSGDARQRRESGSPGHQPAAHPLTVTVGEAGMLLGISRTSAYACVARGEIPTVRLGRRVVVPTAQLMAMLDQHERPDTRPSAVAATEQLALPLN